MRLRRTHAPRHDGTRAMPRARQVLNLVAATASVAVALFALATDGPSHEAVHASVPAAAFASALAGSVAHASAWLAHLAMVLNVAGVVVLSAFAFAAGMASDGSLWLALCFAAGASLASWNVASLSSPALDA